MKDTTAYRLLSENLTSIYGYAYARLYDKDKADELTSEIVFAILSSVHNLENEQAFWGYAWKIADNTFRRFLRRTSGEAQTQELTEEAAGADDSTPEEDYIQRETESEEKYLLRRELSLLKKTHREVCVAYYMENKSCSQIAKEQNISVEMVKYLLFKTRKLLKEGIGMTRTLGEKSYNPGTLRLDFWGDWNHYCNLCDRKLPGSILLAAYYEAMTAEALSMELGVSMPYLEDELEILEKAGVLKKTGEKYQTNIVIITDAYEKEFVKNTSPLYPEIARSVFEKASRLLPQVRALAFHGNDYDDNRLLFGLLNLAFWNAYQQTDETSPLGKPQPLPLGGNGWVFGHDNDYINHHFQGIAGHVTNRENTAWFSCENYRVIGKAQFYKHSYFTEKAEALCDAILGRKKPEDNPTIPYLLSENFIRCEDGILSANFPVFPEETFHALSRLLAEISGEAADCMIRISDRAEKILSEHAPASVRNQCGDIAKIHHRLDAAAFLLEAMIDEKLLTVPDEKVPLCMWGVKKQ